MPQANFLTNPILALITGATTRPSTIAVRAPYSIADPVSHPPQSAALLGDRAVKLGKLPTTLSACLSASLSFVIDRDLIFSNSRLTWPTHFGVRSVKRQGGSHESDAQTL